MLPEHVLASGLTARDVSIFAATMVQLSEPVAIHFRWRPVLRDPGDEMVLEAAVSGRADALVTFNQRDFRGIQDLFGIDVLLPREALKLIRSKMR